MDKIKKLLELGNKPQAIIEIDTLIIMLEKKILKKKGKRFLPLNIPVATGTSEVNSLFIRDYEIASKQNEIIYFLNERYPV